MHDIIHPCIRCFTASLTHEAQPLLQAVVLAPCKHTSQTSSIHNAVVHNSNYTPACPRRSRVGGWTPTFYTVLLSVCFYIYHSLLRSLYLLSPSSDIILLHYIYFKCFWYLMPFYSSLLFVISLIMFTILFCLRNSIFAPPVPLSGLKADYALRLPEEVSGRFMSAFERIFPLFISPHPRVGIEGFFGIERDGAVPTAQHYPTSNPVR